jgi:molecular chaperone GrpE
MMAKDLKRPEDGNAAAPAPDEDVAEKANSPQDTEGANLLEKALREKEQAAKERDEYLDLLQRSRAEFDNYRKRNVAAREDARSEGVRDTICKFLPVLDNLERAAVSEGGEQALREGVQLVLKQFNTLLANAGVEEIAAEGCVFDPNLHHAVMQEEADGVESGKIASVLQKGYRMGDKVLRHCMVKVAE